MYSAPSVSYPVGRSRDAEHLLLTLWFCGAASAAGVGAQLGGPGWRQALLALGVGMTGLLAWRSIGRRNVPTELNYDGQHWSLSGRAGLQAATVRVALDLQFLLLVHLAGAGRAQRWIWLDRRAKPERWRDLRRAVYSRAPSAGPAADARRATSASAHHPLS
jgi:hypothetical protein